MNKIDWKARLQNKTFWVALASFIGIIAKQYNLWDVPDNYNNLVNMGLGLLTMLGIIVDTSTPGVSDK